MWLVQLPESSKSKGNIYSLISGKGTAAPNGPPLKCASYFVGEEPKRQFQAFGPGWGHRIWHQSPLQSPTPSQTWSSFWPAFLPSHLLPTLKNLTAGEWEDLSLEPLQHHLLALKLSASFSTDLGFSTDAGLPYGTFVMVVAGAVQQQLVLSTGAA